MKEVGFSVASLAAVLNKLIVDITKENGPEFVAAVIKDFTNPVVFDLESNFGQPTDADVVRAVIVLGAILKELDSE